MTGFQNPCTRGRSVVIELGNGLADGGLVQDLFLVDQARHEGGGADLVDAAWQTLGEIENSRQGIIGEERTGVVTSGPDVMPDVAERLGQIERAEVIADGQALVEGFMDREVKRAMQRGMADQDDGGQGLAVHLVREQESQGFEQGGFKQMRFIQDHERQAALGCGKIGEGLAQAGPVPGWQRELQGLVPDDRRQRVPDGASGSLVVRRTACRTAP